MAHTPAGHPFRLQVRADASATTLGADVLARLRYGHALEVSPDPRDLAVAMDAGTSSPACELWLSPTPVRCGEHDGLRFACNDEVLVGSIQYPRVPAEDLRRLSCEAYARIFSELDQQGYPCLLRIWNYLGGINAGGGDDERYRLFSSGRFDAFALQPGFEGRLPAATAVGLGGEGLQIRFLAARSDGQQIENPRQVSAFRYPRQYGPRSPSFSRATLKSWPTGAQLFLSGTASIVGHETRHAGDVSAQLSETLVNIEALLTEAARFVPSRPAQARLLKLYLRRPEDRSLLQAQLRERFGADVPLFCLQADICRRDLLLEIEGVFQFGG